jgi:hypothetical protein
MADADFMADSAPDRRLQKVLSGFAAQTRNSDYIRRKPRNNVTGLGNCCTRQTLLWTQSIRDNSFESKALLDGSRNEVAGQSMATLLVGFDRHGLRIILAQSLEYFEATVASTGNPFCPPWSTSMKLGARFMPGDEWPPTATAQLIDQPTIVNNATG